VSLHPLSVTSGASRGVASEHPGNRPRRQLRLQANCQAVLAGWFALALANPLPDATAQPPLPLHPAVEIAAQNDASEDDASPRKALTTEELSTLAEQLVLGDQNAEATLRNQGASIIPRLRPLIPTESQSALDALIEAIALEAIRLSLVNEGDVRYRGQFAALRDLGPEGALVMLRLFSDEDQLRGIRARAATGLGDLGGTEQIPALQKIAEDYLSEAWVEREAVFLLARFGDRARVDDRLARLNQIAGQTPSSATIPEILTAHGELAEVHYRISEYDRAVSHYLQKQALLEEMSERVRPELRSALRDEIDLLQYNLACSLSLAGRIPEAFAALDRSMESRAITLDMVRTDGDLRAVRSDPKFEMWWKDWANRKSALSPDRIPDNKEGAEDPPTGNSPTGDPRTG